jgi:hypothetical protein
MGLLLMPTGPTLLPPPQVPSLLPLVITGRVGPGAGVGFVVDHTVVVAVGLRSMQLEASGPPHFTFLESSSESHKSWCARL